MLEYKRRKSSVVNIGDIPLGGENPIRIQSMTSTSTMDTAASVVQCARIIDAGADYVRLTAQGVREANNLAEIEKGLHDLGYSTPLVADIHFNPKAAEAAACVVEKVRINPGNFVDPGRTFVKLEFTDEEYAREIERIEQRLIPFIELCRAHNTAIRIGVNHGSLSDRIMSRYGDTPAGMAESAMEFLRVFVKHGFTDVVISIKASNTVVMVNTVKLLVSEMEREGMSFPLHLGVTEAGNGEDGRIKSAVGIGALLHDGIGDTIRVSLSEEPEAEIPVARMLVDHISKLNNAPALHGSFYDGFNYLDPPRRPSRAVTAGRKADGTPLSVGGTSMPVAVGVDDIDNNALYEISADLDPDRIIELAKQAGDRAIVLHTSHSNAVKALISAAHLLVGAGIDNPVIPSLSYHSDDAERVTIEASADFGYLLLNGMHDGIKLDAENLDTERIERISLGILQAARLRFTHTEFISCPGCGRTLFDLQSTVNEIKEKLPHLKHLKIGVMGCIVNGPGEMADADYGYVGAGVGKVSLYRRKECVEKNIPTSEALRHLIDLLKADGVY